MGIDYTTYHGPYARCKTTKVESAKTKRTCSRESCSQYEREVYDKNTKFCVQCGSTIQDRQVLVLVDNVSAHEIRETLLAEALVTPGGDSFSVWMRDNNTHLWLANRRPPDARKWSFYPRETIQHTPVTPDLIAAEIEQFNTFFEKELTLLRQEYGEDNVVVEWGLIHYIH